MQYSLTAKNIIYQKDTESNAIITQPDITVYRETTRPPWHLTAEQGIAHDNTATITLQENIHIWNQHPKFGRIEIITETLNINTQEEFVQTDKPVIMRTSNSTTTATGMKIQLQQEKIELLSNVRGTYAPL